MKLFKKQNFTPKNALKWSWGFTKIVVSTISIVWVLSTIFSAVMVFYAIKSTGQFSYLDTFIVESSTTFRDIVGINIIKSCVENLFKYNDFVPKKKQTADEESSEITG